MLDELSQVEIGQNFFRGHAISHPAFWPIQSLSCPDSQLACKNSRRLDFLEDDAGAINFFEGDVLVQADLVRIVGGIDDAADRFASPARAGQAACLRRWSRNNIPLRPPPHPTPVRRQGFARCPWRRCSRHKLQSPPLQTLFSPTTTTLPVSRTSNCEKFRKFAHLSEMNACSDRCYAYRASTREPARRYYQKLPRVRCSKSNGRIARAACNNCRIVTMSLDLAI
jgi:hypothetical protein